MAIEFLDGLRTSSLGAGRDDGLARLLERLRRPAEHDHLAAWLGRQDEALWRSFYDAIAESCRKAHRLERSDAMSTMLQVQLALVPRRGYRPPATVELGHDVVAYFDAFRSVEVLPRTGSELAPLSSYGPGRLSLQDPLGLCDGVLADRSAAA